MQYSVFQSVPPMCFALIVLFIYLFISVPPPTKIAPALSLTIPGLGGDEREGQMSVNKGSPVDGEKTSRCLGNEMSFQPGCRKTDV